MSAQKYVLTTWLVNCSILNIILKMLLAFTLAFASYVFFQDKIDYIISLIPAFLSLSEILFLSTVYF